MNSRTTHQGTERSADEVLDALRGLMEEAEDILSENTKPVAENRLKDLRHSIDNATRRLQNGYGMAQQKVRESARDADKAIRDNPYSSLAAGVGLGILAGLLLGRK